MRILRKINKGVVLTLIVLAVLISYLVNQEIQRGKEKDNIKDACEKYINLMNKYSVLPEKYQTVKKSITEEEFRNYIEEFKRELQDYTIKNDKVIDLQSKVQTSILQQTELSGYSVTTKFNRKIKKIKRYEFDNNQVNVTMENDVEKEVKTIDFQTEQEKTSSKDFEAKEDMITLKKEDGQWKIVYSNLQNASEKDTINSLEVNREDI